MKHPVVILNLSLVLFKSMLSRASYAASKKNCFSDVLQESYNEEYCNKHWDCTAEELLRPWKKGVNRTVFSDSVIDTLNHTPLWLRIDSGKLFCVKIQKQNRSLRLKRYRALHYVNRLNRILHKDTGTLSIPDNTEWWSHQSDLVKIPYGTAFPPVFSVAGAEGYLDIAGIPFMSFSDRISEREGLTFRERAFKLRVRENFDNEWTSRRNAVFFRGALSDCGPARESHKGNYIHCARAKLIHYAVISKHPFLSAIYTTSKFHNSGDQGLFGFKKCSRCSKEALSGEKFAYELLKHKYAINMPGAGNWSRRMSVLLQSGSLVFQAESPGYQFYEFGLSPGSHFIPFDPEIGKLGAGNLIPRVEWATRHDDTAKKIAFRGFSFVQYCLNEGSIDYFTRTLLRKYSALLNGILSNVSLVDLSECSCYRAKKPCRISRLCKGIIDKCWE